MGNLINIASFDYEPLFLEVMKNRLWINKDSYRAMVTGVEDVMLRGPDLTDTTAEDIPRLHNEIACVDYTTSEIFPECMEIAESLLAFTNGQIIGRVIITVLDPGQTIKPHIDEGDAGEYYDRFHAVIQGGKGNTFTSGDQSADMYSGEIWWVNNHIEHSVVNDMPKLRIHMIVDIGG